MVMPDTGMGFIYNSDNLFAVLSPKQPLIFRFPPLFRFDTPSAISYTCLYDPVHFIAAFRAVRGSPSIYSARMQVNKMPGPGPQPS